MSKLKPVKIFISLTFLFLTPLAACKNQQQTVTTVESKKTIEAFNSESSYNQILTKQIHDTDIKVIKSLKVDTPLTPLNIADFRDVNFSDSIRGSQSQSNIGIIGNKNKRLKIILTTVKQTAPFHYQITGQSWVKNNTCDFIGELILKNIYEYETLDFGVDEEFKNKGITKQGVAVFEYDLRENIDQKDSGAFLGRMYSKWCQLSDGSIHYFDIDYYVDGHSNNLYQGLWTKYGEKAEQVATWADLTLPNQFTKNNDLNIGAGDFSPNPKYLNLGWQEYLQEQSHY